MATVSRCFCFLVLAISFLCSGCGNGTAPTNQFPVVVFSDVHFNPFYDPSLCPALLAADSSDWAGIFKTSSITTPSGWQTDTNYPLLVLALSSIKQNSGDSPLVIFTGDLLGHTFSTLLNKDCGTQTPAVMQAFADKTAAFVMQQVRSSVGNTPVMFTVGNSDSYTGLGPDSTFLSNTAELYYSNFLNGSVDHQTFLNTFKSGGYYSAEPMGTKLMVIGLNTNLFSPPYPGFPNNDSAVASELAWLDTTLASARTEGKKVWLLMHIPPGADIITSGTNYAAKGSLTAATAAMMWMPSYQESFLQILSKYPGVITLTLAAHTHRDEFRIMTPNDLLAITPSISPFFGNDPAFKVFTFAQDTYVPIDYRSVNYDLAASPVKFSDYYSFSTTYSAQGSLNASFALLYPSLSTDYAKQTLYKGKYNSGNNSMNAITNANWNPITYNNWPVFACGIGNMAQQDLIDCVNSY